MGNTPPRVRPKNVYSDVDLQEFPLSRQTATVNEPASAAGSAADALLIPPISPTEINPNEASDAKPACSGREAGFSYFIVVLLTAWIIVLAALGAVLASQSDPSDSLKDGVFWFSIVTFPALLLSTLLWLWFGRCTVQQICTAREEEFRGNAASSITTVTPAVPAALSLPPSLSSEEVAVVS
jgi:hypothetical protein